MRFPKFKWIISWIFSLLWFLTELELLIKEGQKMEIPTIMWFAISTYLCIADREKYDE